MLIGAIGDACRRRRTIDIRLPQQDVRVDEATVLGLSLLRDGRHPAAECGNNAVEMGEEGSSQR